MLKNPHRMSLNKLQQQAVDYLSGPLLVVAGPGTGKTQLLSAKVANILEKTDTNPENILCITFTESGATNMRTRLTSMLGARAAGQVRIHTYHAFGSDLLAQYKNYAAEFTRQLDSPIDAVTQHKIIKQFLDQLPALDILKSSSISDVIDTIMSAKSARLSSSDLKTIAEKNLAFANEVNSCLNDILQNLVPRSKFSEAVDTVYQPLLETLSHYISDQPIVADIEPEANFLVRDLNEIITLERTKEKPSISPLTKWKDRNFEKDPDNNYRLKNLIANKKLLSLSRIMQSYDQYLEEHGLFDFADMIEEAIQILKTDDGFRFTLQETFQYILLDEFQDTNPSQFELIKLLTDYESPNIMAVGDDDQAIFTFQGASASNLIDFQNHYNSAKIVLTDNYRSTQEILDLSHQISTQLESHIEKRLVAVTDDPNRKKSDIKRHEFLVSDAEYLWVAKKINALIENGVSQKDIAIITPKHKYIPPLLPYLKAFPNIHISYEKRENVLEFPPIHALTTLARFIYELEQEKRPSHRLLEILSFPFWEIPPYSAISAIDRTENRQKAPLDYLKTASDDKLQRLADFFAALVAASYDTPLELFLDYLTGAAPLNDFRSPFISYYDRINTDYQTYTLYENLSVLREHIRSHVKSERLKLTDFIAFLDDYEAAGESIINTSPYQDSSNAVQIMSAHKSKGLEFEHVFLISADNLSWGKAKGNNNLLSLPKNLISIRHTGITDDERLRLLFVAITRAKRYLTITNSIKDYAGKTPERLEYLNEYENAQHEVISPFLKNSTVTLHYDNIPEEDRLVSTTTNWLSSYKTLDGELRPTLEKRLEHYKLTATDLVTFIDIVYAGPLEFYKRKVLRAPSEPTTESLQFGNLIHSTFEAVTTNHLTDEEASEYFKTKVAEEPVSPEELKQLEDRGLASLNASLKAFGKILRAKGAKAEVDFYHEHLLIGDVPITGKIDHLNINEQDKTIEVYDFKTGNYHPEKWQSHATLLKYALQLGFYKLLLNTSPTYRKYEVKKAHILFVTPDSLDNRVYDKVYDYSKAAEDQLIALIQSVYRHIKSFDYLDDSSLALLPDSSRTLKDIKVFLDILGDK